MTSISSLGIGSGLDTSGLLDKLTAAEQAPLQAIQKQQASYSTKLSAYGTLQSLLTGLQTAAAQVGDPAAVGAYTATSSATNVLSATATSSAVAGSYSVNVTRLAHAQSLVSTGVGSTTAAIGAEAATITIDFGSIAGTLDEASGTWQAGATFTADAAQKPITVSLAAGQVTLAAVRDAINQNAGAAVSASIVNDGANSRLVLTSGATGQKSSLRVTVGGANAALQSLLANDPAGTQALRQTVAASDAALTVNGIAVTSPKNTVAEAAQGVTLTLADTGASTVTVQRDTASVQSALNTFAGAYNRLNASLNTLSAYDASNKTAGTLLGDFASRTTQTRLRAAITAPRAGDAGDPGSLSDLGLAFQRDGSLALDTKKLSAALAANPAGVARLLAGTSDLAGIGKNISSAIDGLQGSNGVLTLASAGVSSAIKRLGKDADAEQDRIDARIAVYRKQFEQLDLVMSSMTATSNYLTQQFSTNTTSKK